MLQFTYRDEAYECDESAVRRYSFMCDVLDADHDARASLRCFQALFPDGKDREYADRLGDSMDEMGHLLSAAIEAVGRSAKNS